MDITVQELKQRMDEGNAPIMIDVREPHEWERDHLAPVQKIALADLPAKLSEMSDLKDTEVVMICRSGGRSGRATMLMMAQGFSKVRNLAGGMLAWKKNIDPGFDVE